jgi:DNA-binding transcriptional MerR regulator
MARETLLTLDELSAAVSRALAVDYAGSANGRVRDVPDRRTIRYYTTLGLIDRPAAMRGRTALYSRRHLLQLVAIKRLQAEGKSLAEVQARMYGLTDAALSALARLPDNHDAPPPPKPEPSAHDRRAGRFWGEAPAPVARALLGVPLADGVTLLLSAARTPDEHDLSALRQAAAPFLELLRARGLLAGEGTPSFPQGDAS